MSGHWADTYVGRAPEGARPCWMLVRQVWIDRLGFEMPRFDEFDSPEAAARHGTMTFRPVPKGEERDLDAVMMFVPLRDGKGRFRNAEAHVGVIAGRGLVLHCERGRTAFIEPLRGLHVSRIIRGPWEVAS